MISIFDPQLTVFLQLHCVLVEVRDGGECVPFSALPFYKGFQQTVFGLLEDLSGLPNHGPKIHQLVRKFACHGKYIVHLPLVLFATIDFHFRVRSHRGRNVSAASYGLHVYL